MYTIGLFATGRGSGSRGLLQAIHEAIAEGRLPVRIAFVFSNREKGEFEATDGFFEMVRGYGYPLVTHSFRKHRARTDEGAEWRKEYEAEVARRLAPYAPDLCVLAGFLLIVPELSKQFTMVNLHPAAPGGPIGMWQEVIWQLIERRAASSGNTMLHVTEELDKGPTVSYCTFPISGPAFREHWEAIKGRSLAELWAAHGEELPLFQAIRRHGMARERPLVVETVKAFAEGRVRVRHGLVEDGRGNPLAGLDLTAEIEALLDAERVRS